MAETLRKGNSYVIAPYAAAEYELRKTQDYGGTLIKQGRGITTNYVLRGYRPGHSPPDFEQWVATDLTTPNPSGEPVTDVTIISSWVAG